MKKILITGCSSGIGLELAKQFLEKGHQVIATARNLEKLNDLSSGNLVKIKLDVTNKDDIAEVAKYMESNGIDILINNAGYGLMGPVIDLPVNDIRKHFETNVFGQIELIQNIAPIMLKQGSGTIVNIGSISGIFITPYAASYCATKAAFNSFSDALRMELKPFGINVISVQPGGIKSEFGNNTLSNTQNLLKEGSIYEKYRESIIERATFSQTRAMDVSAFAKGLVSKILSDNPPALSRKGSGSILLPLLKKVVPERILDYLLMKKFGLK